MNNQISIVLVSNHRYMPGLAVTMSSILRSASDKARLDFHIFTDDLTEDDVKFLNDLSVRSGSTHELIFHRPDFTYVRNICSQWNGSYLPWVRMFVADQVDANWIVYADVDTLWFLDVCKLWEYRDDSVPIFWARDMEYVQTAMEDCHKKWNPEFNKDKYACSGMVLLNLKMMRELNLAKMTEAFIKKFGCPYYVDQDVLNYYFNDSGRLLPQVFLCMRPTREALHGTVLHCLGIGRMFNGPMKGWSGTSAIWYRYYNKYVNPTQPTKGCGWFKSVWYHIFGLFYPSRTLYKFLTIPCASHRAEQLTNMQFHAWLFAHSSFGR